MSSAKDCRMYANKFPEVDECVMVQVTDIEDMGAYVVLLEYGNIEGMIMLSELSRRRIRSVSKIIRVGRTEVCMVLRVDQEKGYIDLSKRRVSPEDIVQCDERYQKSRTVHSIMRQLSEHTKEEMETLYERIAWPLSKKFGHAYDAFKLSIAEPEAVWGCGVVSSEVDERTKAILVDSIAKRLTPQAIKVRADVEVTCFAYEGIEAVRKALLKGAEVGTEEMPVRIRLVAPPLYVVLTQAMEKDKGIELLEKAVEAITAEIRRLGGDINVKQKPRAISAQDEKLLHSLMEALERQNEEVGGDEEEAPDEGMGNLKIEGGAAS